MLFLETTAADFCSNTASIWGVVGWVVFVLKIVIPLLLIIFGMLDLGKAVIASDDKAISKAVSTLIQRFIAAVVVFFVPTIVVGLFNALTGFNASSTGPYGQCVNCVLNVTGTDCNSVNSVAPTAE